MFDLFQIFFSLALLSTFMNKYFCSSLIIDRNDEVDLKNSYKMIEKRQDETSNTNQNDSSWPTWPSFTWPEYDGPESSSLPLLNTSLLETGYWWMNNTFYQEIIQVNKTNKYETEKMVISFGIEQGWKYTNACFELTNSSANSMGKSSNEVLGRVVIIPVMKLSTFYFPNSKYIFLPNSQITGVSPPVEFGCWLRSKDGDPNVPLYDYTNQLLLQLGWDPTTVKALIEKRLKAFQNGDSGD